MKTQNEKDKHEIRKMQAETGLDSEVNTTGFPHPEGESQTIQEDPRTDPDKTDKPGFRRSNV